MSQTVEVRVLRTMEELDAFRPYWDRWTGHSDSDPDLFRSYVQESKEVERPHVVVLYRGGVPDAMLVGRLERVRIDLKVGYVHLRPKAKIFYFVYGGPRGNASYENCELLLNDVKRALSSKEADAAYLSYIRVDSGLHAAARKVPGLLSRDYSPGLQPHYSANLENGIEEFYKTLSPKVRKNQRWQSKRLEQTFHGDVVIRCYRSPEEVGLLAGEAEEIAGASYQRGLGVGFVDTPAMQSYLRAKAAKGNLRGYVLTLQGRAAAFWIGTKNEHTFVSNYLGFYPEYAKYSPGMYLILRVIEGMCADPKSGISEIDFATGQAQYKEVLGNRRWNEASVYIFASSIRGCRLSLLRAVTGTLDKGAKQLLARTGLLQKIKKGWRARATARTEASLPMRAGLSRSHVAGRAE